MRYFLSLLISCLSINTIAQTIYTWTGATSIEWAVSTNWSPNGVPTSIDHVVITTAVDVPMLSTNQSCANFTLSSGNIDLGGYMLTIGGNAVFTAGTVQHGTVTILGATTTSFGGGPVVMNCLVNVTSASITIRNTTFQGTTNITKTGASNDVSYGQNTFNGTTTIINNGSGYWQSASSVADVYNSDVTFSSLNGRIIPVQNGINTQFNGIITVNCTSAVGGVEIGNNTGTTLFSSATTLNVGVLGFSAGTLQLSNVTQATGGASLLVSLSDNATFQISSSTFTGSVTFGAPRMDVDNNTFGGITSLIKSGASNDNCGGNIFLTSATLTNSSAANWIWGSSSADIFNSDLTTNNSGTANLYLAYNTSGNQFNGVTILNNNGSGESNYTLVAESAGSTATFNSTIVVNNTSTATENSLVRFNYKGNCTFNDNIVLNSTGAGYGVYFSWPGYTGSATLASSKAVSIGSGGFSNGSLRFYNFTQLGTAAQTLTLTGTSTLLLISGSIFNGNVNFTAPRIRVDGSVYNGTTNFTKTGPGDDYGTGGNTFVSNCTIVNSSSSTGIFITGNGAPDVFSSDLTVINQSSAITNIAYHHSGLTTTIAGNLYVVNSGSSDVKFNNVGDSHLTVSGTTSLTNSGSSRSIIFNDGEGSINTFFGNVTIDNIGATSNVYMSRMGNASFKGDILVGNSSSGKIYFGDDGGASVLDVGKTISVGSAGFNNGQLSLRNFTQSGATTQILHLTGSAGLVISSSSFSGDVDFVASLFTTTLTAYRGEVSFSILTGTVNLSSSTFTNSVVGSAPSIVIANSTFLDAIVLTKTGTVNDDANGGNTFYGSTTFIVTNTGRWRLSNIASDAFNGDVTFLQNGSGLLQPSYLYNATYSGNISTVGSGAAIAFGSGGGRVTVDGASNQFFNGDAAKIPTVARLTMQTNGGELTLGVSVNILTDLTLTAGKINTTDTELLTLTDESVTVTNTTVSSMSYIDGPMRYVTNSNAANSSLFFPIGNGSYSRPVQLTYTHTNTTAVNYTARNFASSAKSLGFTLPSTLDRVSEKRHYKIDRSNVSNLTSARVTIYYDMDDQVTDYTNLRIAKSTSDASPWIDIGGMATSNGSGSIQSNAFSSFSYFALANDVSGSNPLPVELLFFKANVDKQSLVHLAWCTGSEKNSYNFSIERSSDGESFESIKYVNGSGNSSHEIYYEEIDQFPLAGLSYYRLKQTDFDGHFSYSKIIAVAMASGLSIYPNPTANGVFFVSLDNSKYDCVQVTVKDNQGLTIVEKNYDSPESPLRIEGAGDFAPGFYQVTIKTIKGNQNFKLIVD